jgi:2-iminobutanoate/2-iminopropanoate deaminase
MDSRPGTPENAPMRFIPALIGLVLVVGSSCATPHRAEARRSVHHPAEGALGPYSGSVLSGGLCFVSGKIGKRGESFAVEAHSAIDAVAQELERSELSLADVVSATVFLTDMGLYGELNTIYSERFPAPYPARACIAVRELPAGARVEIQVIARRSAP